MSEITITPEEQKILVNSNINEKRMGLGKSIAILLTFGILFISAATWIGYQFFWYKPVYESVEDYQLQTAINNVKKYPGNAALRVELGWNFMQSGNLESAKKEFQNALKLDDTNIGAKINLGMVYAEEGSLEKAKQLLEKTVKDNPRNTDAHLALGQLLIQTKDYDRAIKEFNYLLFLNPGTIDFIYLMGKAYEGKGDILKAKEHYKKALEYVPDYEKAMIALSKLSENGVKK